MTGAILFVSACLIWQVIKDWLRGEKPKARKTVRLTVNREVAECGCDLLNSRVVSPCAAHRTMIEVQGE